MSLDPRLHPIRADLAAAYLKDQVTAPRYAEGTLHQVTVCAAPLRAAPQADAGLASEAVFGESVTVYDENDGWAWVQAVRDGYVGYTPTAGLSLPGPPATHWVHARHTFLYPEADIKTPPCGVLPMTALAAATGTERNGLMELAAGGWVFTAHLSPPDRPAPDFVTVAERFLETPSLWGGKTGQGLDCSGLLQTSLCAAGDIVLRDTDMQKENVGEAVDINAPRRRGDIVFFPGHVGVMTDATTLIHANAWHMAVTADPLADVTDRLAEKHAAPITAVRRL